MEKQLIRIALTKGRLEKDTVNLFEAMGYDVGELRDKGRRLILSIPGENIEIVLAKAVDVITYVEHGVCDAGVVGKDTIMEYSGKYFEIFDLGFGKCRFALAGKSGFDFYSGHGVKSIATKYTNIAREFFEKKGINVDVIKIEGSVELAPLLGLADGIVDIVETGKTLAENGLEVYESISDISARFIVNTVSMKIKKKRIDAIVDLMKTVLV